MYPLEKRTYDFSKSVIFYCKNVRQDSINRNIIQQLLRSSTSIGANYREANGATSRLDFRNKIHICKKEAQESYYWLNLLGDYVDSEDNQIEDLIKESNELVLIFGKIASTMKNSKEKFDNQKQ